MKNSSPPRGVLTSYKHPKPFSEDVAQFLYQKGYTEYHPIENEVQYFGPQELRTRHFQKKLSRLDYTNDCKCNDKLHMNVYLYWTSDTDRTTVSMKITAETGTDDWVNLEFYGIDTEKFKEEYLYYCQRLIQAWDTIY